MDGDWEEGWVEESAPVRLEHESSVTIPTSSQLTHETHNDQNGDVEHAVIQVDDEVYGGSHDLDSSSISIPEEEEELSVDNQTALGIVQHLDTTASVEAAPIDSASVDIVDEVGDAKMIVDAHVSQPTGLTPEDTKEMVDSESGLGLEQEAKPELELELELEPEPEPELEPEPNSAPDSELEVPEPVVIAQVDSSSHSHDITDSDSRLLTESSRQENLVSVTSPTKQLRPRVNTIPAVLVAAVMNSFSDHDDQDQEAMSSYDEQGEYDPSRRHEAKDTMNGELGSTEMNNGLTNEEENQQVFSDEEDNSTAVLRETLASLPPPIVDPSAYVPPVGDFGHVSGDEAQDEALDSVSSPEDLPTPPLDGSGSGFTRARREPKRRGMSLRDRKKKNKIEIPEGLFDDQSNDAQNNKLVSPLEIFVDNSFLLPPPASADDDADSLSLGKSKGALLGIAPPPDDDIDTRLSPTVPSEEGDSLDNDWGTWEEESGEDQQIEEDAPLKIGTQVFHSTHENGGETLMQESESTNVSADAATADDGDWFDDDEEGWQTSTGSVVGSAPSQAQESTVHPSTGTQSVQELSQSIFNLIQASIAETLSKSDTSGGRGQSGCPLTEGLEQGYSKAVAMLLDVGPIRVAKSLYPSTLIYSSEAMREYKESPLAAAREVAGQNYDVMVSKSAVVNESSVLSNDDSERRIVPQATQLDHDPAPPTNITSTISQTREESVSTAMTPPMETIEPFIQVQDPIQTCEQDFEEVEIEVEVEVEVEEDEDCEGYFAEEQHERDLNTEPAPSNDSDDWAVFDEEIEAQPSSEAMKKASTTTKALSAFDIGGHLQTNEKSSQSDMISWLGITGDHSEITPEQRIDAGEENAKIDAPNIQESAANEDWEEDWAEFTSEPQGGEQGDEANVQAWEHSKTEVELPIPSSTSSPALHHQDKSYEAKEALDELEAFLGSEMFQRARAWIH